MATLKDIAKLACVNISTVSRALRNTSYVHPDTKAKIMAAVKELSYEPNVLNRMINRGKSKLIGVIIPKLQFTLFEEIVKGINDTAKEKGYSTLICDTEENAKIEKELIKKLKNSFVDGIIIAGTGHNTNLLKNINYDGIAVTQVLRRYDKDISSVIADYSQLGYDAVNYLVKKGCINIAFINGPMNLMPYKERYKGYMKAIEENEYTPNLFCESGNINSIEYGYDATLSMLNKKNTIDSIITAVDIQGVGVLRALKKLGKKVPDDIRLVSLSGHPIGSILETPMTVFEVPAKHMGKRAAEITIEKIESDTKNIIKPKHIKYSINLKERESS